MYDDYEDNELMTMVKEGNKTAYENLVLRHRVRAIAFANSFVANFHTAEDIVQECFAKIYINRQSYKASFAFKTYLFTVIRNGCIDHLRKRKLSKEVEIGNLLEETDGHTPEEILAHHEDKKALFAILNSLQDDYKTALYLYALCDMSYKEIAGVMEKSIPQVKIIIYRARQKLKKLYKGVDICEK